MMPNDPTPPPAEIAPAAGEPPTMYSIDNPPPDEVAPAASAFLACLPLAVGAGLAAAYWPSWAHGFKDRALTGLFYLAPVLSGLLAVPIHYFNHPIRRPNLWKCSVWIWTWSLALLVFICIPLHSDLGGFVVVSAPFTFMEHGLYILLALVGLGIGEFWLGIRRGWKRWWTPAEWRYYTRQSALALLVLLLVQLVSKCHL